MSKSQNNDEFLKKLAIQYNEMIGENYHNERIVLESTDAPSLHRLDTKVYAARHGRKNRIRRISWVLPACCVCLALVAYIAVSIQSGGHETLLTPIGIMAPAPAPAAPPAAAMPTPTPPAAPVAEAEAAQTTTPQFDINLDNATWYFRFSDRDSAPQRGNITHDQLMPPEGWHISLGRSINALTIYCLEKLCPTDSSAAVVIVSVRAPGMSHDPELPIFAIADAQRITHATLWEELFDQYAFEFTKINDTSVYWAVESDHSVLIYEHNGLQVVLTTAYDYQLLFELVEYWLM